MGWLRAKLNEPPKDIAAVFDGYTPKETVTILNFLLTKPRYSPKAEEEFKAALTKRFVPLCVYFVAMYVTFRQSTSKWVDVFRE